jgi:ABC-2 type transport system permease protein
MRMYFRELKAGLKSLFIWTAVVAVLIIIALGKFAAFHGNPESLAILDTMPPQLLDALSMRAFNLTTVDGFFGVMFVYFALMAAMAAALWGSEAIAKEERDRTVEFTLVLPVPRRQIVTAKLLAALTNCALFVIFTWIISVVSARSYAPEESFFDFLRLEMLAMFLIELVFLALGTLLACVSKTPRRVGSVAIGLILGLYFISIFAGMHEKLTWIKYLTPFGWFNASDFFRSGRFEPYALVLTGVCVVIFLFAAYFTYDRRDLYI